MEMAAQPDSATGGGAAAMPKRWLMRNQGLLFPPEALD